jgi:hypothetical protein
MKNIVLKLVSSFLFFYLSSISVIHGQSNLTDIPFKIDVKENFRNIKAINLSNIGKELSYIPLETTPECLIQSIRKILFSDSYIFISEFKRLLQFDKNGKFIRQIGSAGSGPGEYLSIGDFCIDEQKKEIYIIFSSATRLLIYGFDGVFKNSINLTFRPAQIIPKDQNSLIYHLWNVPGKNDPSWIITNRQGITATSIKNNLKRISQPGFIVNHTPLYSFDNTLHFMEFGIDTLYYFNDTQKKPYAVFFLDDLKMDADPLITPSLLKDEKLLNKFWIGSIIENNVFLFIKFFRGISNATMCAIYNKKTATVTFLKENVFINDLDGGVKFWPKQIINDNILVDYIDAFDLLKKQSGALVKKDNNVSTILSNMKKQISETSNPVLILLK